MSDQDLSPVVQGDAELSDFAVGIAAQVESFLVAIREIARGANPDTALSMLLLEVSQLALAGGRLGAIADVVPEERFEPDAGPDTDVDELRERLAALLEPVDAYVEVVDPLDPELGVAGFQLSADLAGIVADLIHGLKHYHDGQSTEALWWWQFSYLSSWGTACGAVLRALHSLIAHTRLDREHDPATAATERELLAEVDG